MDKALRFGDVLQGFILASANIREPVIGHKYKDYKIDIDMPNYCVVIAPCSIKGSIISLTPLIEVKNSFFNNPYFTEDLTVINREIEPIKSVPPDVWEAFPSEKKQERLEKGKAYVDYDKFIYEKHSVFPKYQVHRKGKEVIETRYYMVDFRCIYKVVCQEVKSPEISPLHSKVLQLSQETRKDFMDKLLFYYERIKEEDIDID